MVGRLGRAARAAALALIALLCGSCTTAVRLTHPPPLDGEAREVAPAKGPGPSRPVEILGDERGVPLIFAESEEDLIYGLGFMHARDRALVEAHVAGIHEGALHAGRSLEMQVLGTLLGLEDGTFAYRMMGNLPRRKSPASGSLPQDGASSDAGWAGFFAHDEKPRAENPLFATRAHPQAGWSKAVRAEEGLPVHSGAVLRFVAKLEERPRARMVLDFGNNGHLGHRLFDNPFEAWDKGLPFFVPTLREEIERMTEGRLVLPPQGGQAA